MEIKLKCECGQVLKVGEEAAGKVGTCPACNNRIRIPSYEEIQQAREQQTGDAEAQDDEFVEEEVEEEIDEEIEEEEEERPARRPSTRGFKAPARSKTRSKALADLRGDKEDKKKKSSGRTRRKEKGKTTTRGKTKSKTRAGRRTTSVMDKYRAKSEDDEEGGYTRKKKSPLKILIVIAIVVVGGLVAAYALHWGPIGKAKARTREYIMNMEEFVRSVRDSMIERYEKRMPASTSDYSRRLEEIKEWAGRVQASMNRNMEKAYRADDIMHDTIRILGRAQKDIEERVNQEKELKLTEEKLKELNDAFTAKIAEVNVKVAEIAKLVKSIKPKIGMRMQFE